MSAAEVLFIAELPQYDIPTCIKKAPNDKTVNIGPNKSFYTQKQASLCYRSVIGQQTNDPNWAWAVQTAIQVKFDRGRDGGPIYVRDLPHQWAPYPRVYLE